MSEEFNQTSNQTMSNPVFNKGAITSFVCSLVGLIIAGIPCGIVAIILGIIGLVQINDKSKNQKGRWMAIIGIIIGIVDIVLVSISLIKLTNNIQGIL